MIRRFRAGFTGMSTILHWGTRLKIRFLNSKNPSALGREVFHRSLLPLKTTGRMAHSAGRFLQGGGRYPKMGAAEAAVKGLSLGRTSGDPSGGC